jgi:hypothetical protein
MIGIYNGAGLPVRRMAWCEGMNLHGIACSCRALMVVTGKDGELCTVAAGSTHIKHLQQSQTTTPFILAEQHRPAAFPASCA